MEAEIVNQEVNIKDVRMLFISYLKDEINMRSHYKIAKRVRCVLEECQQCYKKEVRNIKNALGIMFTVLCTGLF